MSVLLLSGTRVVAAGGGGGGGGGANPNEPAGMTVVWPENPMSTLPPSTVRDSFGFLRFDLNGNRLEQRTDGSGGFSDPNYLRLNYPQGILANADYHTPFSAGTNLSGASLETPRRLLYLRIRFRISANWTDSGNTGTKLAFFSTISEGGHTNSHYLNLTANDVITPSVNIERNGWTFSGIPSQNYEASGAGTFAKNTWHDMEVLLTANTVTAGVSENADGAAQLWMNGVQRLNQTGICFFSRNQTPCWRGVYFNPTYGGGFNPPSVDVHWDLDHYYSSVRTNA